jgi:hypothetical protein
VIPCFRQISFYRFSRFRNGYRNGVLVNAQTAKGAMISMAGPLCMRLGAGSIAGATLETA